MPEWKKNIFVNAIRARTREESRTAGEILTEYTKLLDSEKAEILQALNMEPDNQEPTA